VNRFLQGLVFELGKSASLPIAEISRVFPQVQKLRGQAMRATEAIKKSIPTRTKGYIHPAG